jgi:hypothetical protein
MITHTNAISKYYEQTQNTVSEIVSHHFTMTAVKIRNYVTFTDHSAVVGKISNT